MTSFALESKLQALQKKKREQVDALAETELHLEVYVCVKRSMCAHNRIGYLKSIHWRYAYDKLYHVPVCRDCGLRGTIKFSLSIQPISPAEVVFYETKNPSCVDTYRILIHAFLENDASMTNDLCVLIATYVCNDDISSCRCCLAESHDRLRQSQEVCKN